MREDSAEFWRGARLGGGRPLLPWRRSITKAVGAEALRALSNLARVTGQEEMSKALEKDFEKQRSLVNDSFWIADKKRFAFALDKTTESGRTERAGHSADVVRPAQRGGCGADDSAIGGLRSSDDWGMRIISNRSPLFQRRRVSLRFGVAAVHGVGLVAEYRYHQTFQRTPICGPRAAGFG